MAVVGAPPLAPVAAPEVPASKPRRSAGLPGLPGRLLVLGPALVVAAAYVDPGNVVTNTIAGARYGYLLVWVVVAANVTAALVQYLSAKLGIITGRSLPEIVHATLSPAGRIGYWVQAEVVAMATDLAEVVGGAIALQMLACPSSTGRWSPPPCRSWCSAPTGSSAGAVPSGRSRRSSTS